MSKMADPGDFEADKKPDMGRTDSMTGKRLIVSQRTPKTAADPEVLQVTEKFVEKSGSDLANGWKLGKQVGRGNQGAVYLLEEDGKDAGTDSAGKMHWICTPMRLSVPSSPLGLIG